jgi:hypothetical protein
MVAAMKKREFFSGRLVIYGDFLQWVWMGITVYHLCNGDVNPATFDLIFVWFYVWYQKEKEDDQRNS